MNDRTMARQVAVAAAAVILALAAPWPVQAHNQPCFNDKISNVDSSGNYIRLNSGQFFKVFPGDNRGPVFWLPLDRVTVCGLGGNAWKITDLDHHGETVQTLRLN